MKDLIVSTNYTHLQSIKVFDGDKVIAEIKSTFNDIEPNIVKLVRDIPDIQTVNFVGIHRINEKYLNSVLSNFELKKRNIKVRLI